MFVFLGGDHTVNSGEIIGIFDIERCSVSRTTADYLGKCQKSGKIVNVSQDMPKAFVVCSNRTYITNVSCNTLNDRARAGANQWK